MAKIRSILAPTDFSTHATIAVRCACGLAADLHASLHLIHILPDVVPVSADPMLTPVMPPEFFDQAEVRAREALGLILEPSWGTPGEVITAVQWGAGVDEIVAYASRHTIDLIVVATHGRSGFRHALLGSDAERIVREAPCPVLTVKDPG